jgi:hypothetical protein
MASPKKRRPLTEYGIPQTYRVSTRPRDMEAGGTLKPRTALAAYNKTLADADDPQYLHATKGYRSR